MNGISIAHTTSSSQPLTEAPSAAWTAACNPPSRNCPSPFSAHVVVPFGDENSTSTLTSPLVKFPAEAQLLEFSWKSSYTNLDASSAISQVFRTPEGKLINFFNPIRSPLKSHHVWWLKPLVPAISAGQISLDPVAVNASLSENSVPLHPMVNDHYPY